MKRHGQAFAEWQRKPEVILCGTERQWAHWAAVAASVGGLVTPSDVPGALRQWCNDCTPDYQESESAEGRCYRGRLPATWHRGRRSEDTPPLAYRHASAGAWCVICCGPYRAACNGHQTGVQEESI